MKIKLSKGTALKNFSRHLFLYALALVAFKTIAQCPAPSPVTASTYSFCGSGGNVNLNATSVGNSIDWYTIPSGGTKIGSSLSGVNFSVNAVATTTYYAEALSTGSSTFNFSGGIQSFTVPAGVTTLSVDIRGAQGGAGSPFVSAGGNGGRVTGTISVTPGQVLNIYVGGAGGNGNASFGGSAGYNGGGVGALYSGSYAGGGGGGASDIRVSPFSLANRLVVAGGGGGGAYNSSTTNYDRGGMGGGTNGESGYSNSVSGSGAGGYAGTQSAGGGGGFWSGYCTGSAGVFGIGGNAGTCTNSGGGGGGGYYGGGGGVWAGGGGGSGFLTSGTHTPGYQIGNGQVVVTYNCISPRTAVVVNVFSLPPVSVNSGSISTGSSFTMVPSGAVSYSYTPGGPIVSPTITTSYTVTGTAASSCTNVAISTVSIQAAALHFDGGSDFVDIGSVIPINSSYTKEAWVYANASSSNNIISSNSAPFWIMGGQLSAYNNATPVYQDPAAFPLNQWVHVAVTYNASTSLLSLYKNGILVTSGISGAGYPGDAVAIGQYGTTGANFFQGAIDEVRIWNRPLCQGEIQNNMNAELPLGQTGLLSYYKMNQGFASLANPTATVLIDASGNSNNAPLTSFALNGSTSNWIAPGGIVTGSTVTAFSSTVSATAATTSVNCNGTASGSATITASGGSPYTYLWSPSGGTLSIASGLAAGNYSVLVTNICGASTTVTLSIAAPSAITLNPASQTNVACFGGSTGAAQVNAATGGAGGFTYDWTPGTPTGDGTTSVTGLTANTWVCTVTDANSCTKTQNFTVTQPPVITLNPASQTNVACFGGSTGSAQVNAATGGAGSYTYDWTPGTPTGDGTTSVTGLTANAWACTVTDVNGCSKTQNFTVTQPPNLTGSTVVTNIACFGGTTGSINLTPSGGTPAYTFNWGGGITTEDRIGLAAGNYSVTITDANSCTRIVNVTLTQPASNVSGTTVVTNITCFGGSNGAINLTPTGGTGPYTFNWLPSGPITEDRAGLTAGTYTVQITDANVCTGTVNATVTQPPNIAGSTVVTNIACFGGTTGSINLTPSGGTPGYTFNWGGGITTEDRIGLAAGNYSVTITDANNCTRIVNATVTQPASNVSGTTVVTNAACFGGTNGSINLTPNGGTPGYTFNWGGGVTTEDRTGLAAGNYSVTITDANGCAGIVNATVTQPTAITATTTQTNVLCNGGNTGRAFVSASGGTGSFTYSWAPSGGTGATATGLVAGNYTCTISDANFCSITKTVTITQLSALSLVPSPGRVYCNGGNNGYAQANISGGTGAYTFTWSPSLPAYNDPTYSFASNLIAGGYTVTATDGNSCTISHAFNITQPTPFTVIPSQTNVSCNGGSNGSASVTVSGSNTGYTYNWSSGGNASSVSGLAAGVYNVAIQDNYFCTTSQSFTITEAPALIATSSQTNVICFGASTGMASVNASGGTGVYTYSWSPNGGNAAMATNLSAGTYTNTITDANGCSLDKSFVITENAAITSVISTTNCNSYTLNGTTYTSSGIYTQTLANASSMGCDSTITLNLMINQSTSSTLTEIACSMYTLNGTTYNTSGTYTQLLTNVAGCDSTITLNLTINQPTSSTLTEVACSSYVLNGTTYNTSGTYTQLLTNAAGCDSTITLNLTINQPTSSTLTEVACSSYVLNGTTYNTSGIYTQLLTNAAGCDSTITLNLTINQPTSSTLTEVACSSYVLNGTTYNTSGTYTQLLTNVAGCDSTITLDLTINALPTIMAMTSNTLLCTGETATLSVMGSVASYTWSTTETTMDIVVSPTTTTTYTVDGMDANGCSNTTTITQDVSLCTGIVTLSGVEAQNISVYPNPTNGIFYIELTTDSKVNIMNALGQTVIDENMSTGKHELDIHNEADGIYFVKVIQNNLQQTIKIIKK